MVDLLLFHSQRPENQNEEKKTFHCVLIEYTLPNIFKIVKKDLLRMFAKFAGDTSKTLIRLVATYMFSSCDNLEVRSSLSL